MSKVTDRIGLAWRWTAASIHPKKTALATVMTNADRILDAIQARPGLTDAQLRKRTGVEPNQQVNQICRRLEAAGLVRRVSGPDGLIVNLPGQGSSPRTTTSPLSRGDADRPPDTEATPLTRSLPTLPPPSEALVIIPCSGRKVSGGGPPIGQSVLDVLPGDLAAALEDARRRVAPLAHLDETQFLPAWRRYAGTLYQSSHKAISEMTGKPLVVISGGYGIVLSTESIGMYGRPFAMRDWPRGLLENCLIALAEQQQMVYAIAFCARTTGYSQLVRSTPWARSGIQAHLVTAELRQRGGAQVLIPKALGGALVSYLRYNRLDPRIGGPTVDLVIDDLP